MKKKKSKLKSNPIARQLRTDKFRPKKVTNKKKLHEKKRIKIKL
jgi:hypothetical protein